MKIMKARLGRMVIMYLMISGVSLCAQQALTGKQQVAPVKGKEPSLSSVPREAISKGKADFNAMFNQAMQDSKGALGLIKTVITSLDKYFSAAHYLDSSKIKAIAQDSQHNNKSVGLVLDFTHAGAGPLVGFEGFIVDPVVETVPLFLQEFCSTVIAGSLKPFFNGKRVFDPETKKIIMRSSPFIEFLMKLSLLLKDKAQKNINAKQCGAQLFLLTFRITQTEGFKNVNDLFKNIPAPLKPLLEKNKIQNKPINAFLNTYFKKFQDIAGYDFTKPETSVLKKKDVGKVINILTAIFLRAMVDYSKIRATFLKTSAGKVAFEAMRKEGNVSAIPLKDTAAFRQQVPGFSAIEAEMQERIMSLVVRFSLYKKIRLILIQKLSPIADPLLEPLGLTLDDILPSNDKVPSADSDELLDEKDIDDLLDNDSLFGDIEAETAYAVQSEEKPKPQKGSVPAKKPVPQKGSAQVEENAEPQKESVPAKKPVVKKEEPAAVEQAIHPIDWMYEVMDEYDKFDQSAVLNPARETELEAELMDARDTAFNEWTEYNKQDLIDLGYTLLDAQSYLDDPGHKKRVDNFLSSVKKKLHNRYRIALKE